MHLHSELPSIPSASQVLQASFQKSQMSLCFVEGNRVSVSCVPSISLRFTQKVDFILQI